MTPTLYGATRVPSLMGFSGWSVTDFLQDVVQDPALPTVVNLIGEIVEIETGKPAGEPSNEPGVGLRKIVPALKAFVVIERNPWLPWAAGFAALALPFLGGVLVGRAVARRRG